MPLSPPARASVDFDLYGLENFFRDWLTFGRNSNLSSTWDTRNSCSEQEKLFSLGTLCNKLENAKENFPFDSPPNSKVIFVHWFADCPWSRARKYLFQLFITFSPFPSAKLRRQRIKNLFWLSELIISHLSELRNAETFRERDSDWTDYENFFQHCLLPTLVFTFILNSARRRTTLIFFDALLAIRRRMVVTSDESCNVLLLITDPQLTSPSEWDCVIKSKQFRFMTSSLIRASRQSFRARQSFRRKRGSPHVLSFSESFRERGKRAELLLLFPSQREVRTTKFSLKVRALVKPAGVECVHICERNSWNA